MMFGVIASVFSGALKRWCRLRSVIVGFRLGGGSVCVILYSVIVLGVCAVGVVMYVNRVNALLSFIYEKARYVPVRQLKLVL